MEQKEFQEYLVDFERNRSQLIGLTNQKQQLEMQNSSLDNALEELDKTKEKKVYKVVGNILLLSDVPKVKKELKEQKETISLRLKTLKKQEDAVVEKLNQLKSKIESFQKQANAQGETTEKVN